MKENKVEDKDIENVFNGQYNEQKGMSFDQQKEKRKVGDKLVKYNEPQVDTFKGKDSIMVLGGGNISVVKVPVDYSIGIIEMLQIHF